MRVTHDWQGNRVTIRVEGLRRSVRALHLGDLHLGVVDDRDPDRLEVSTGKGERFHHRHDINDDDGKAGSLIEASGIPSIYTPGNHDWHFSGEDPPAGVRRVFWPRLDPLTGGQAAFSRRELGAAVRRSRQLDLQIEENQLELMRQALATDLPTVLLSHIPISLPTLRGAVMEAMDGNPSMMADPDWAPELRVAGCVADTTLRRRSLCGL